MMSAGVVSVGSIQLRGERGNPGAHQTEPSKCCRACGERKPWSAFYLQRTKGDIPVSSCKECDNARRVAAHRKRMEADERFAERRRREDRRRWHARRRLGTGLLPIDPFREWLVSQRLSTGELAVMCGVMERRIYGWLHESQVIRLGDLDAALTRADRPDLLSILYPLEAA